MKTGLVIIHYNDYESVRDLIVNVKDYSTINKIIIVDNNSRKEIKEKAFAKNKIINLKFDYIDIYFKQI